MRRARLLSTPTLSGRSYLPLIQRLRTDGWQVELLYLALPNVEISRLRVAERVAHGGHSIPADDISRRFPRSLKNFLEVYSGAVDRAHCFLNSGPVPDIVFVQQGEDRTILDPSLYELLIAEANR